MGTRSDQGTIGRHKPLLDSHIDHERRHTPLLCPTDSSTATNKPPNDLWRDAKADTGGGAGYLRPIRHMWLDSDHRDPNMNGYGQTHHTTVSE